MTNPMPGVRPAIPHFSSGPCAKRPGWSLQALTDAALGRSHRAKLGKAQAQARHRSDARDPGSPRRLPHRHRARVRYRRGRDGAVVAARRAARHHAGLGILRRRLGHRRRQGAEAQGRHRPQGAVRRAAGSRQGRLVDATSSSPGTARPRACACRMPTGSPPTAQGLTICDATSAAFAQRLDWAKLDVVTFSWQKALGGEAAHGMLILSPRAVERLESLHAGLAAAEDLPHDQGRQAQRRHLRGRDHQHAVDALRRGLSRHARLGEIDRRPQRADRARRRQHQGDRRLGRRTPWVDFLARDPATRSNTSVCLKVVDPAVTTLPADAQAAFAKSLAAAIEKEGVGYDIAHYRDAPPGLRIWCGATVEATDVEALTPGSTGPSPRPRTRCRRRREHHFHTRARHAREGGHPVVTEVRSNREAYRPTESSACRGR